jgi:hypothetical protein
VNYLHIVAVLLGLVGVVPALTLASPVKVAHRAIPTTMIFVALVLWFLPTGIDLALACVPVAAWISARLGIDHAGHEPANYDPAVRTVKGVAQAARERVRPSKPIEIRQFVDRAYPNPDDKDELADSDAAANADDDVDDEPETQEAPEPTIADKLELAATGLPAEYQAKLAGQRAGRDNSAGPRNRAVSTVPKFVPSLLG